MLLTLTTTYRPATDLGYLLHKNPHKCQSFPLAFGTAHVFYPEIREDRCTAALLLELDPIDLVRGRKGPAGEGRALEQYVNDRPYVASSFLSVAIARVFGSALAGRSKDRPELADRAIPVAARIAVLPCRGGERFLQRLFEPLGYKVTAERHSLDDRHPEWGESPYYTVTLTGICRLKELLSHLYVLIPVLDNDKHYWVGDEEVEKLLRHGGEWLAVHPEREPIARRYLKHQQSLARQALGRLAETGLPLDSEGSSPGEREAELEAKISLNQRRIDQVVQVMKDTGARSVVDLGCGDGKLLGALLKEKQFEKITGMDVSIRALEIAKARLNMDRLPHQQQTRMALLQGSLSYRDARLAGYEAATVIEVIEHLDAGRLSAFQHVLFESIRPSWIVLTTPNREYNGRFEDLPAGQFRHPDHRFEWSRAEFEGWAGEMAERHGYEVRFLPVGEIDPDWGPPTQMGVFKRIA